ncbi:MAG: cell division protein ZapE [Tateyamaria sp.]|jgi:cell division protein ZapE|nr:cell division protein ZapE [Tateyamaria sp.]MDG0983755.1 cell division protein ZapE [Tateyamaria sp.]MDG1419718.1 cell division protein ZapE [Tateyamaria sp.]MDG1678650.1 cell division protein ZapE [Tateyamaria sp.]
MANLISKYNELVNAGTLRADNAQLAVLPEFDRIQESLAQSEKRKLFRKVSNSIKGLYLYGGVGCGKSMVMDLFVANSTVPVKRVHFHAFMQDIHAAMHLARKNGVDDAIKPVAKSVAADVRVLAFDEMQINDITDAMIVGRLFEALFASKVVVVTTSNRAPDELYKDGLNRSLFIPFIEMLKQQMVVHQLTSSTDYRKNRLSDSPTYFTPINLEAHAQMDTLWADFTGGASTRLDLTVNGRTVTLPQFRNGIGRASFFDLCAKSLGPADFLAIAKACKVLMIDDIPMLSRSNFNEAKRFVILIDALYEARVRLICSAATSPEMLYLEGEGTFEFVRTASRLHEMQGKSWGS